MEREFREVVLERGRREGGEEYTNGWEGGRWLMIEREIRRGTRLRGIEGIIYYIGVMICRIFYSDKGFSR